MPKFNHLDLFSGIGGFALAAQWTWGADHNVVCFCEMDKFCQKVLNKHWPGVPIVEDIRNVGKIMAHTIGERSRCQGGNTLYQGRTSCKGGGKSLSENSIWEDGSTITNNKPTDIYGGTSELAGGPGDATNVDLLTGGFP